MASKKDTVDEDTVPYEAPDLVQVAPLPDQTPEHLQNPNGEPEKPKRSHKKAEDKADDEDLTKQAGEVEAPLAPEDK